VTAELMYRRFDARIVMAMAAAHQLSFLEASMDGRNVVTRWRGRERVAHFIEAAAVLAQVDPVAYGLLEKRGGRIVLAPQPAEQWVTHLADMYWLYAMGAAHLITYPLLKEIAESDLGITGADLSGRPFNQLKNYVWSQLGQISAVRSSRAGGPRCRTQRGRALGGTVRFGIAGASATQTDCIGSSKYYGIRRESRRRPSGVRQSRSQRRAANHRPRCP
jgi:hypothetical protein